jgi:hypothetical protein
VVVALTPDAALEALRGLISEFRAFCCDHGNVTEADTRAKVIDAVLRDVLGWPESGIEREASSQDGFMDYVLSLAGKRLVVVEAKREGVAFEMPIGTLRRLKLNGVLAKSKSVLDASNQVRQYCDNQGIRFAIATNGYAWIVFRAIREDMPWREGSARVFYSLEEIESQFTAFWNLLSRDAVEHGSLDAEFSSPYRLTRQLHRIVDRLHKSNVPLQRNRLHAQLDPLISTFFSDIADQDQVQILRKCYVHSESLKIVAKDLDLVIKDVMPRFLRKEGTVPLRQSADGAGEFGIAVARGVEESRGELFLLLGGIGSGKTTFLKRYQKTIGRDVLDQSAVWFYVNFLDAPLDPLQMEDAVWREVLGQMRRRYASPHLETRRNIKAAFADEIHAIEQTALRHHRPGTVPYEEALSPYLAKWQEAVSEYVPRLLRTYRTERGVGVVFFIDNVDQLAPAYQAQIFQLAQRVTSRVGAVTVIALREESYYTSSVQKTFTAYSNKKFHIASPRFRQMIGNRIEFALKVLRGDDEASGVALRSGIELDRDAIATFLTIVERSIFQVNPRIASFVEAVCFGNMRLALQMFSTFLTSGATDVDKMLRIYWRDGAYFVAYHEFVRSIMLGDRCYYREAASPILNVFDCGADPNSSHFTSLRVLECLLLRRGESTVEGPGYVDIEDVLTVFEDLTDNRADVLRTLARLVAKQLVETDTRSAESIDDARFVRVTGAGWYYVRHLVRSFCYLDLVLQDTPLNSSDLAQQLKKSLARVDNLADSESEKTTRLEERFRRVEAFLEYLVREEEAERKALGGRLAASSIGTEWSRTIRDSYERERDWIRRRVKENRERYGDDLMVVDTDEQPPEDGVYDDEDRVNQSAGPTES